MTQNKENRDRNKLIRQQLSTTRFDAFGAVLVAIAIPVFTSQLEKSREATDLANLRSAYGEAISEYLTNGDAVDIVVAANQTQSGWQSQGNATSTKIGSKIGSGSGHNGEVEVLGDVYKTGTTTSWHVQVSKKGEVSINGTAKTGADW